MALAAAAMSPEQLAEKRAAEAAAVRAMISSRASFIAEQRARIAALSPKQAKANAKAAEKLLAKQ